MWTRRFDNYDMSPALFGTGKSARTSWFYFTEDELTPGAARVGNYKAVATVPQIYDLWQDPQERYDLFMTNWTERTWTLVTFNEAITKLMKTYIKYPPRKLQSETYTGPITISRYQRFKNVREELEKEGISLPMPTGN